MPRRRAGSRTARSSRSCSRDRRAGSPTRWRERAAIPVPLRDGRERSAGAAPARLQRVRDRIPINVFQANPFGAGSQHAPADRRVLVRVRRPAAAVPQAVQPGRQHDRQLHLRQIANRPLRRRRRRQQNYRTLRDKGLEWGPTAYDLRHTFQTYWTYDLPFGKDRAFSIDNALLDQILGGWSASGVVRIQTGRPFLLTSGRQTLNQEDAGVVLNGITVEELQSR